jgi:hypothetical protein
MKFIFLIFYNLSIILSLYIITYFIFIFYFNILTLIHLNLCKFAILFKKKLCNLKKDIYKLLFLIDFILLIKIILFWFKLMNKYWLLLGSVKYSEGHAKWSYSHKKVIRIKINRSSYDLWRLISFTISSFILQIVSNHIVKILPKSGFGTIDPS